MDYTHREDHFVQTRPSGEGLLARPAHGILQDRYFYGDLLSTTEVAMPYQRLVKLAKWVVFTTCRERKSIKKCIETYLKQTRPYSQLPPVWRIQTSAARARRSVGRRTTDRDFAFFPKEVRELIERERAQRVRRRINLDFPSTPRDASFATEVSLRHLLEIQRSCNCTPPALKKSSCEERGGWRCSSLPACDTDAAGSADESAQRERHRCYRAKQCRSFTSIGCNLVTGSHWKTPPFYQGKTMWWLWHRLCGVPWWHSPCHCVTSTGNPRRACDLFGLH